MRLPYFTQDLTMGRFASKSSSKTFSGSFTYVAGVAMATSGRITSHLRMWYSIHSRLMVMSPSKKWKRGCGRRSATRSEPMSMPYTSQSVSARIFWERWWPMKPFTPRMQMRLVMVSFFWRGGRGAGPLSRR